MKLLGTFLLCLALTGTIPAFAVEHYTATVVVTGYSYYNDGGVWGHKQIVRTDQGVFIKKHSNYPKHGPFKITYYIDDNGFKVVVSMSKL